MRQQRHGNHLEQHQHIHPPVSEDLPESHLRKRTADNQHGDRACDVSDIFDSLVQQHRWLPAGQINHERRQRRCNARLPQDFPLKVKTRLSFDQTHAVTPAEQLEGQHGQRHIEGRLITQQRLHDRIAEKPDVAEDEHEPVQPGLAFFDAQQPCDWETQADQRGIEQRDQAHQPQRLPD